MSAQNYRVHIKTNKLEFEVEGDKAFVEQKLKQYTGEKLDDLPVKAKKSITATAGAAVGKKPRGRPKKAKTEVKKARAQKKVVTGKKRGRKPGKGKTTEKDPRKLELIDSDLFKWFSGKKPNDNNEIIVLFAHFFKDNGIDTFSPAEIIACYGKIGKIIPKNIGQNLRILSDKKKGYLAVKGRGEYQITDKGADLAKEILARE